MSSNLGKPLILLHFPLLLDVLEIFHRFQFPVNPVLDLWDESQYAAYTHIEKARHDMDNWDEIWEAFKSATIGDIVGDIIGALCLFAVLFMGLFFVLIFA